MKRSGNRGMTWLEVIVALSITGILAALAFPVVTTSICGRSGMTSTLSNMRLLYLATQSAAQDGAATGNTNLGWPGDTGGTFTDWMRQIVPEYLSTNDFCKLLSAPGKVVPPGALPAAMSESAVLVYAVRGASPTNAVFFSSANFTNGPKGGQALQKAVKPFGGKSFLCSTKAGTEPCSFPDRWRIQLRLDRMCHC